MDYVYSFPKDVEMVMKMSSTLQDMDRKNDRITESQNETMLHLFSLCQQRIIDP